RSSNPLNGEGMAQQLRNTGEAKGPVTTQTRYRRDGENVEKITRPARIPAGEAGPPAPPRRIASFPGPPHNPTTSPHRHPAAPLVSRRTQKPLHPGKTPR